MRNIWLMVAAALDATACLLHVGVIGRGAAWYRFFGAGEEMARAAEHGSAIPGLVTAMIALVLAIWALYALSAAGLIVRLPLLRTAMLTITVIYLLRAFIVVPMLVGVPRPATPFWIVTSLIVLAFGIVHAIGTWRAWPDLSPTARRVEAR